MCQASAGATVKHQPESVSWINRNSVKDQVKPERQASPGVRHFLVPPAGIEPATHGLGNRCGIDSGNTQGLYLNGTQWARDDGSGVRGENACHSSGVLGPLVVFETAALGQTRR